jgi:hypothetical protein
VKVEPVSRSLRKRKQVKYNIDNESDKEEFGETYNETFEEPSILAHSKKFSTPHSRKLRKVSDHTDMTESEEVKDMNI